MNSWEIFSGALFWVVLTFFLEASASETRSLFCKPGAERASQQKRRVTEPDEISLLQTAMGLQARELPRPVASPADVGNDSADWLDDALLTPPEFLPSTLASPSDAAKIADADFDIDSSTISQTSAGADDAAVETTDSLDAPLPDLPAEAMRLPWASVVKPRRTGAPIGHGEPNTFALPRLPGPDPLAQRFVAAANMASRGSSASNFAKSYLDTYELSWPSKNNDSIPEAVQAQSAQLESLRRQEAALKDAQAEIKEQAAAEVRLTLQAAAERVHDTLTQAREALAAEEEKQKEHREQAAGNNRLATVQLRRMMDQAVVTQGQPATLVPWAPANLTVSDNCGDDEHYVKCGTWNRIATFNYRMTMLGGCLIWVLICLVCCCCGTGFGMAAQFEAWVVGLIQVICCFLLLAFVGILYLEWHY